MTANKPMDSVVVDGLRIDSAHPCLAGHFPGNPIVPAVVLLDEVQAAIQRQLPGFIAAAIPAVKFLSPLMPGESFSIRMESRGADVHFECFTLDRTLAKGRMLAIEDASGG